MNMLDYLTGPTAGPQTPPDDTNQGTGFLGALGRSFGRAQAAGGGVPSAVSFFSPQFSAGYDSALNRGVAPRTPAPAQMSQPAMQDDNGTAAKTFRDRLASLVSGASSAPGAAGASGIGATGGAGMAAAGGL